MIEGVTELQSSRATTILTDRQAQPAGCLELVAVELLGCLVVREI